ncbi:fungal pheromone mating factor STE2 GPCR-domain-containing protein [Echria macrotheca]|uniref:Fungal pheromone mating factor STE2 GPCR-domain-containing protein n=1 Tax=Echria macrotheca TaxID=438768 RepID=A0AAJ0B688_9PEZI|nr:fungal pheromone mating factor STE2 GPCR-domain-containing protein [Echria macrotheca]
MSTTSAGQPSPTRIPPAEQSYVAFGPTGDGNYTGSIGQIDLIHTMLFSEAINYGSQIGACIMMVIIILAMTPLARLKRLPTLLALVTLTLNIIRLILFELFFRSSFASLYVIMTADTSFVPEEDFLISCAGQVFSVPITMLVLFMLFLQAWSMVQLWRLLYKVAALAISAALSLTTIALAIVATVQQYRWILYADPAVQDHELRYVWLIFTTTSISWFCFLFISRLVMHMWTSRSILPSLKGLTPMDVLVMTSGVLMLIPVVFAALQNEDYHILDFQAGSLVFTSVMIILPLGTLIAQRLANPQWFNSQESNAAMSNAARPSKRPLMGSDTPSNGTNGASLQGRGGGVLTSNVFGRGQMAGINEKGSGYHANEVDAELARIDNDDLERGNGVHVARSIERRVEPASGQPSPSSS